MARQSGRKTGWSFRTPSRLRSIRTTKIIRKLNSFDNVLEKRK